MRTLQNTAVPYLWPYGIHLFLFPSQWNDNNTFLGSTPKFVERSRFFFFRLFSIFFSRLVLSRESFWIFSQSEISETSVVLTGSLSQNYISSFFPLVSSRVSFTYIIQYVKIISNDPISMNLFVLNHSEYNQILLNTT